MPVRVEKINDYLFSDTVQSRKTKVAVNDVKVNDCENDYEIK